MESAAPAIIAPPRPSSRRVLCAEDHVQMAELIQKILTRAGHEVVCVFDGQQALDRASEEAFDVVITDHHMPNVSGLDLVAKLRANGFAGKILLHTSRLSAAEDAAYQELAVDAILMKPAGILRLPSLLS